MLRSPHLCQGSRLSFDETGAVIPACEIVFRSDLKKETSVSRTGMDGSVTVKLRKGRYVVTAKRAGFAESKMTDVQIVNPMPDALHLVLKVDFTPTDGPVDDSVPTTACYVPSVIESSIQPTTRQRRSWRCLYLWKCSTW